jgi:hypothetical protein
MEQPTRLLKRTLRPNSRFKSQLVAYIRDFAREAAASAKPQSVASWTIENRVAALHALADYIASVPTEDPRLFQAAQVAQSIPGVRWAGREPFEPTVTQSYILFSLGDAARRGNTLAPEQTFSDLLSAGIADIGALHRTHAAEFERKCRAATKRAEEAEAKVAPHEQLEADLVAASEKSATLQAEIDRVQKQLADLEGFTRSNPRRVHVGGGEENKGIYRSELNGTPVFEIGFTDAEGRQRWRRLDPDASVEDARGLRKRLAGQPYRDPEHGGDGDGTADQVGDEQQTTEPEPGAAGEEAS